MTDIVEIGEATLYHGDCMDILPTLGNVDAVVTDPPYGMNYSTNWASDLGDGVIVGDKCLKARDYVQEWSADRACLMFGTWKVKRPEGTRMLLIWDKGGALGMDEEIYICGGGSNYTGKRTSDVLRFPPVQSMAKNGRVHPVEKPVRLMIELVSKTEGFVCDPFMGSGTTGVACANLGRKFIGIEIERKYFDIACERIEAAYAQGRLAL